MTNPIYEAMVEKMARAISPSAFDPEHSDFQYEEFAQQAREQADNALAALGITPDHEVWIAPVEPTDEMLDSGCCAVLYCDGSELAVARDVYAAMRKPHTGREE